ncbi:glycosyltransferase family 2 protein [Salmonella enterica subsp. enterica]|nr:glycosyltransferase family 2 protein [Salmonella enterica subsp. enterica]EBR2768192.1 glycosyltransferase family 2 protein [Salmonella enterica]EBT4152115.1 glycosyltransferase family 2 protein [Salmonella enterica subsp. enterica]EED9464818.1 glycosyltransferase family 2 protein [Salmonella enterica subsp. enterica serovar Abaetetuba]
MIMIIITVFLLVYIFYMDSGVAHMENLTITAAIIVKNEERCISSAVNVVDEIIIVDTGSDDNTIDIINNFENNKIRLYSAGWHQSFSAARNTAIEKATCDYIFFIDADEYLQKPEVSIHRLIIHARVASQENNIVFCPRISDHNGNTTSSLRRFFPNNNTFYYCGYVHEELRVKDNRDFTVAALDITIFHDGYIPEVIAGKDKIKRNQVLNNANLKFEPDNLRWHYFYHRDLWGVIPPEESYLSLLNSITLNRTNDLSYENIKKSPYTFAFLDLMARSCLLRENCQDEILKIIDVMNIIVPKNSNAIYYESIYQLLSWRVTSTRILHDLLNYRKTRIQVHEDMLHSDGIHIDAAISFFLYEMHHYHQAKKLLNSVHDCGFQTDLTNEYLRKLTECEHK